jgi:predicted transcriptional regulator of viral defense system
MAPHDDAATIGVRPQPSFVRVREQAARARGSRPPAMMQRRSMNTVVIPTVALTQEHDRNKLAAAARAGEVLRVRRGAYCAPDQIRVDGQSSAQREERQKALARVGALHSQLRADHVFGHTSAALLLGCRVWRTPAETHVYQRYRASGHAADDVRRHAWTIAPEDITAASGLPVTSLARTVVDCARTLHPLEALVIADSALALGIGRETLLAVLAARPGHRGKRRARLVIELADAGAQSAW